jgi:two-component system sensor kinase FixL
MRSTVMHDAHGRGPAPVRKQLATAFVAVAALCSLAALTGWALDLPALRTFGNNRYPIWPWTALGYCTLSFGYLAAIHERWDVAKALWAVPVLLALASIIQNGSGADLGIDRLLFPGLIDDYGGARPGRPAMSATIIILLFAVLGYLSGRRDFLRGELSGLITSAALGIALAATALMLVTSPKDPLAQFFAIPLPSAIMIGALACGFVCWHSGFGWIDLLTADRPDRRLLRVLLPVALVLPLLPSILVFAILHGGVISPLAAALIVVLSNIAIIAAVAYWAIRRVTAEQSTLFEVTEALENATVALIAPDGTITHWSRGCEQLYGWSAEQAQGKNKYALLRSRCQQGWGSGLPLRPADDAQELVEVRRDGREVAVLERSHQVERRGRPPVVALTMTDISMTAATMSALRASEERLAAATAAHEVGVFEWDVPSGKIMWSPGMEQRLGLMPGTVTDFESWRAQVEPEDVQDVLDSIARAVSERADTFSFRYRFANPNGTVRAVEGSARTYYDEKGNLLRTVGVMLDTTERDERETALRAREAQLRSVLETVPDAMVVIDERGTILRFSAAAEAMWGYRAESVLGQSYAMLAPADERARYAAALQYYLETGHRGGIGETAPAYGETAEGRRFPMEIRTGIARVKGGTLFTMFCRDLTDRLENEERMSDLNAELAHVSRQSAMSELAADLAHELNQPLSATSNFLAAARMLIEKGEDEERAVDLLKMGAQQTQRAGEIIRRLRDFTARGEAGTRRESLGDIVREAAELVLVGTGQLHVQILFDLEPEADEVHADRVQVQQVLVNLLRNAMQALRASDGGIRQITIHSTKVNGNMVEIEVSDTGPGIPENILQNLFQRFTTTKQKSGGMGIGLSISKRIIEAHGGTLSAANRPEGGATFRFTLPVVQEGEYA